MYQSRTTSLKAHNIDALPLQKLTLESRSLQCNLTTGDNAIKATMLWLQSSTPGFVGRMATHQCNLLKPQAATRSQIMMAIAILLPQHLCSNTSTQILPAALLITAQASHLPRANPLAPSSPVHASCSIAPASLLRQLRLLASIVHGGAGSQIYASCFHSQSAAATVRAMDLMAMPHALWCWTE